MSYTMTDFKRDLAKELLEELTPEELLQEVPPEKLLRRLPPEVRMKGLTAEEIRAYLKKLEAGESPAADESHI